MGTFSGLNTALSALHAQRRGLDITGRNVANANTEGYSRQRVTLESISGQDVPAIHAVSGMDGGGVSAERVARLRDTLLEFRAHTEHSRSHQLTTSQNVLAGIERVFGEPSDSGLQAQFGDFWNGWHDVTNRPGDLAARSQLLQRANTLADGFNQATVALDTIWANNYDRLGALVDEVNTAASNVAELNQAIQRASNAGMPAAELHDKRDLLVVRLSELVGATARAGNDGVVNVFVGGAGLVRGSDTNQLQLNGASAMAGVSAGTPVGVNWLPSGNAAVVTGGEAAGTLEALNTTLPGYVGRLDTVAGTLASLVNTQHAAGFDLAGAPGGTFFSGTTAGTLAVALLPPQVAAASTAGGNLNGTNADAMADLARANGGPDQLYRQLVVDLGVDAQTVNRRVEIQSMVTTQVDAARDSSSGVDMDEEMTNMIAFQHAYNGAARLLSAVDEMLDTLINRTGMVGR